MFQPKHTKTKGFLKSIPIVLFLCGRLLLYVTVLFLTMRCAPRLLLLLYWAPGAVVACRPYDGAEGSVRSVWWTPLCGLAPALLSIRSRSHIHYIVLSLTLSLCCYRSLCSIGYVQCCKWHLLRYKGNRAAIHSMSDWRESSCWFGSSVTTV